MRLDLFPLHTVLFPGMRLPLHVFEPRYRAMVGRCIETDSVFGVVLIAEGADVGAPAVPHAVGTTARVRKVKYLPDGCFDVVAVGETRFRIRQIVAREPHVAAEVEPDPLADDDSPAARQAADELRASFDRLVTLMIELQSGYMPNLELPSDPMALANLVAAGVPAGPQSAQGLLEAESLLQLLGMERRLVEHRIAQALQRLREKLDARRN